MRLLIIFLISCIAHTGMGQSPTYRLRDKTINKAQVDSLEKIYGDELKIEFVRADGKMYVDISLPGDPVDSTKEKKVNNPLNLAQQMLNNTKKSFGSKAAGSKESQAKPNKYFDLEGKEISKAAFKSKMESEGLWMGYEIIDNETRFSLITMEDRDEAFREMDLNKEEFKKSLKGRDLSEVQLTRLNGKSFKLSDFKGKAIVLNLWYTTCRPCVAEMPELNGLVSQYDKSHKDKVMFIASTFEKEQLVQKFLSRRDFTYLQTIEGQDFHSSLFKVLSGIDPESENTDNMMTIYPLHIILDQDGKVTYSSFGSVESTKETLESEIGLLLKN